MAAATPPNSISTISTVASSPLPLDSKHVVGRTDIPFFIVPTYPLQPQQQQHIATKDEAAGVHLHYQRPSSSPHPIPPPPPRTDNQPRLYPATSPGGWGAVTAGKNDEGVNRHRFDRVYDHHFLMTSASFAARPPFSSQSGGVPHAAPHHFMSPPSTPPLPPDKRLPHGTQAYSMPFPPSAGGRFPLAAQCDDGAFRAKQYRPPPPPTCGSRCNSQGTIAFPKTKPKTLGSGLRPIDWMSTPLKEFRKSLLVEHHITAQRSREEVQQILRENEISVWGKQPLPKPVNSFLEASFTEWILKELEFAGFTNPYPIQMAGWPIALSGRDMIGIAQTGSGKTLAYLLPALNHICAQDPLQSGDGPIALVLAPTRELAMQIEKEAIRFTQRANIQVACVYGGVSRNHQGFLLRKGVEACIATPGRLIDFLEMGMTNLRRVTYFVLDEADRMLDMGFEPQMKQIASQVRPDRQTLMWSATWPKQVRSLARDFCKEDPITVTVGSHDLQANDNIEQLVIFCSNEGSDKFQSFIHWLSSQPSLLEQSSSGVGRCLVFCETRKGCEFLRGQLQRCLPSVSSRSIHGDKEQRERDKTLADFKQGRCQVLIATDVASRGLDIKNVQCVVNYDVPKTIEDYIHRIGRTGRAGARGVAVTFFPNVADTGSIRMARKMCQVMRDVKQTPPQPLVDISLLPESPTELPGSYRSNFTKNKREAMGRGGGSFAIQMGGCGGRAPRNSAFANANRSFLHHF